MGLIETMIGKNMSQSIRPTSFDGHVLRWTCSLFGTKRDAYVHAQRSPNNADIDSNSYETLDCSG